MFQPFVQVVFEFFSPEIVPCVAEHLVGLWERSSGVSYVVIWVDPLQSSY